VLRVLLCRPQNMLNRFLSSKAEREHGGRKRRPFLASECRDLNEADKWRSEILRDIGKKVMDIQNAALGEHRLRDLNDEINKLIREKGHWESRISALGGPNYARSAPRVTDGDGDMGATGGGGRSGGYRYFGAAKGLPGVKELFEKAAPRTVRRTRHQMYQTIDADYYGFRDEEDGILQRVEAVAEAGLRADALQHWQAEQAERGEAAGAGGAAHDLGGGSEFVAHVPLPDAAAIESLVVAKKKRDLLSKYASVELQAEEAAAKAMLGKRARTDA
jgi:pre-mRNA-splicing factor ISY1